MYWIVYTKKLYILGGTSMEDGFQVKDVVKKTGIHQELVREYSRALEANGYKIARTPQGTRKYTKKDMDMLQDIYIKKTKNSADVNDIAAVIIKSHTTQTPTTPKEMNIAILEQNQKFEEFMDKIHILTEQNNDVIQLNNNLIERHKQQEETIEELIYDMEKRANKRDEHLIRLIRELQEAKRQTAAAENKRWFSGMKSLFIKE